MSTKAEPLPAQQCLISISCSLLLHTLLLACYVATCKSFTRLKAVPLKFDFIYSNLKLGITFRFQFKSEFGLCNP